jgi:hypothetical protein
MSRPKREPACLTPVAALPACIEANDMKIDVLFKHACDETHIQPSRLCTPVARADSGIGQGTVNCFYSLLTFY